jgi:hypothetical protein
MISEKNTFQNLSRITKDNQTCEHEDHEVNGEAWIMFLYDGIYVKTIVKSFNDTKLRTAYRTNNES